MSELQSQPQIVLFDLPSKGRCACWSLNPWKTRLVLNYKSLPYTTQWLEYPDIAPHHQAASIPPNTLAPGTASLYSIPAVRIGDAYIQNSAHIAARLEELFPTPSLRLQAKVVGDMEALMPRVLGASAPVLIPRVPRVVLSEGSVAYFEETRAKRFGMRLEELERTKGGEEAWGPIGEVLKEVGGLFAGKGPFFLGEEVSYADFIFVAFLQFAKRLGEGSDIFERMLGLHPAFGPLYQACGPWLERDD